MKKIAIVIVVAISFYTLPAQVLIQDSLALVAFHNLTNGSTGWAGNGNWRQPGRKVSTWQGVSITGNRVTGLEFRQAANVIAVTDALNALTPLTALKELSLTTYVLSGSIPSSISNFTTLNKLVLSYNNLSGAIPPGIGNLTNLTTLDIRNNTLTGAIPPEIGNLVNLTTLMLDHNQLTSIAPQIGNLTLLPSLDLSFNQITAIPPEIGDLTSLNSLKISSNALAGNIPATIGNLSNLTDLDLTNNQLSGSIPATVGNLTQLSVLKLSYNTLSGPIPPTIGTLTQLITLEAENNQLTSLPAQMGNLTAVTAITLAHNLLAGSIPATFGNLSALNELLLSDNQLSGAIPDALGNLSALVDLNLAHNQLTGSIPNTLSNLTNLTNLDLSANQLSGAIPPLLNNCVSLEYLNLSENSLSGSIPSEMFMFPNLKKLNLNINNLTGQIPAAAGNLSPSYEHIMLYRNKLTGDVPAVLWQNQNLDAVHIQHNLFTGVPISTTLPAGLSIQIDNNMLDFNDIKNFFTTGQPASYFYYSPQFTTDEITVNVNSEITLKSKTTGNGHSYQWQKDGNPITNATQADYTKLITTTADAGMYSLVITNSQTPSLRVEHLPIRINVVLRSYTDCTASTLQVGLAAPNPNATYAWNTAATTSSITATATGNYTQQVETENYLAKNVFNVGLPGNFTLGNDIDTCNPSALLSSNITGANFYFWELPDGSFELQPTLTATMSGTYRLSIVFSSCPVKEDFIDVVVNHFTPGDFSIDGTILPSCPGVYNAAEPVTFTNTTNTGTNFNWSIENTSAADSRVSHTFQQTGAHTITLSGTDSRNCPIRAQKQVQVQRVLNVGSNGKVISCTPTALLESNTQADTYEWQTPQGNVQTAAITATTNGTYTLTVAKGSCVQSQIIQVQVGAGTEGNFTIAAGNMIQQDGSVALANVPLTFTNTTGSGTGYTWTFGDQSQAQGDETNHTFTYPGTYTITLDGTDDNNCHVTAQQQITIQDILITTAISPNGDGKNDTWYIEPFIGNAELKIVDRHGRMVFKTAQYNNDFSGQQLNEGVYFYELHFKEINKRFKGVVSIVR